MVLYRDLEKLSTKTKSSTQINMFFPIAFLGFNRGYSSPLDETVLGRTPCVNILRCANQPVSKFKLRSHGFYHQEYFLYVNLSFLDYNPFI